MIQLVFLLLGATYGALIRGPRTLDSKAPHAAHDNVSAFSCPVDGPHVMDFHFTFQTPHEKKIVVMKNSKSSDPTEEERAEMEAAMEEYETAKTAMQQANERLMNAMEAMLEVPNVNKTQLTEMLAEGDKDTLIVFYAPWCPHCQRYVLHDGKGDPEKAPLEIFNKEMEARGAKATLNIVRWNIEKDRDFPSPFEVQYIPTIYLSAADGTATKFEGDHSKSAEMVAFIEEHSTNTKEIAPLSLR
eukprot:gnl/MRDRNA2_/MRDRNA2_88309_c0_seq1.p1 gnl/MRDRNA2_/MRDRNA2_88309_c0~~gnl/MRDRNA2_/MRDRNA2_88309_c0_seq1.p1  ORF type:complete len:244 (-),score=62.68 gnl/MRDRNA2_/MRDRNA2_88309_c0_seq1:116-847(-)